MRVIAYTYAADVHCPQCTRMAVVNRRLTRNHDHPHAIGRVVSQALDENSVPLDMEDREGNLAKPVFDIDEAAQELTHCGDCQEELT